MTLAGMDCSSVGNTGLRVGKVGLGCAPLGNLYRPLEDEVAKDVMAASWDAGIRLFDTAPHYGQGLSERRVRDGLRDADRRDYVLSTKVGRLLLPAGYAAQRHGFTSPKPFEIRYDYSYDGVMHSFEDSLQRLGLNRIDILLIHDLGPATHGSRDAEVFRTATDGGYRAMAELRASGDVRALGWVRTRPGSVLEHSNAGTGTVCCWRADTPCWNRSLCIRFCRPASAETVP